jgi:hypothetical protein
MGKGVLRFSQALIQPFRQTLFEVRFSFPAQHGKKLLSGKLRLWIGPSSVYLFA